MPRSKGAFPTERVAQLAVAFALMTITWKLGGCAPPSRAAAPRGSGGTSGGGSGGSAPGGNDAGAATGDDTRDDDLAVAPAPPPPVVSGLTVEPNPNSVLSCYVSWTTDVAATSEVQFGADSPQFRIVHDEVTTEHRVLVIGMHAETAY